jgi:ABC-type lipoprotein export system ATPase subunit
MGSVGMVLRTINRDSQLESLGLPPVLKDVVMAKRGLVIMVGATGSGKSTTLAAMVGTATKTATATSSPSKTRSNSCTRTRTASSPSAKWASIPKTGKWR